MLTTVALIKPQNILTAEHEVVVRFMFVLILWRMTHEYDSIIYGHCWKEEVFLGKG